MATKVLHFIGKGQITIPQEWRMALSLGETAVKATLQGEKIIIESLPLNDKEWNVEMVALNEFKVNDQKIIYEGRKDYKKGKKEKFLSASDFFKDSWYFIMYQLLFYESKPLLQDKKKLLKDQNAFSTVQEALGKLAIDPFAKGIFLKKLHASHEATFRLRCGSWRILFDVDTQNKKIIVYRIKQRKEGYL